jgi:hypothetical protein
VRTTRTKHGSTANHYDFALLLLDCTNSLLRRYHDSGVVFFFLAHWVLFLFHTFVYILYPTFGFLRMAHRGTTGALTREASQAAKVFIGIDQGFPNMRLGQDEHAKKAGTDRRRVYRGNRGCFRWSKTAVVNDTFVKHGMTDWTRRKRNVEIL